MNEEELAQEVRKLEARNISIYPKRFYYSYKDNPDGSKKTTEMVLIAKRGVSVPQETPKRWKDVAPAEKAVLQPHYDAWKKGEGTPITGTPLEAWAADPEMVVVLNQVNIRSVEEFVTLEDHNLVKLAIPNGREKQNRAKAYLESKTDTGKITAEVTLLRSDNESLRGEIAELKALIERHAIKKDEPKRGPGRPRKEPIEAMN